MKSNTKQVRNEVQQYIRECMNFEGYTHPDGTEMQPTASNVLKVFKSEYLNAYELKRYGTVQKCFTQWLRGLPTVLQVTMYYSEAVDLLINRFKTNTPAKIDEVKSFEYFLNLIYMNVCRMADEEEKQSIKTLRKIEKSFK